MSSLIEQAAERLAQIRAAGIPDPDMDSARTPALKSQAPQPSRASAPRVERSSRLPSDYSSKVFDLDLAALAAEGYLVPSAPSSHLADQYRVIKRPLIANATGSRGARANHGNLIMMTSAMPGEGKSFTSINLAMSIAAELDHSVLLVDADVARPSILKKLGLAEAPGLLDLLEGKAEMNEVLMRTNIDTLSVLASGRPHPKSNELLASDAMRQFTAHH